MTDEVAIVCLVTFGYLRSLKLLKGHVLQMTYLRQNVYHRILDCNMKYTLCIHQLSDHYTVADTECPVSYFCYCKSIQSRINFFKLQHISPKKLTILIVSHVLNTFSTAKSKQIILEGQTW